MTLQVRYRINNVFLLLWTATQGQKHNTAKEKHSFIIRKNLFCWQCFLPKYLTDLVSYVLIQINLFTYLYYPWKINLYWHLHKDILKDKLTVKLMYFDTINNILPLKYFSKNLRLPNETLLNSESIWTYHTKISSRNVLKLLDYQETFFSEKKTTFHITSWKRRFRCIFFYKENIHNLSNSFFLVNVNSISFKFLYLKLVIWKI